MVSIEGFNRELQILVKKYTTYLSLYTWNKTSNFESSSDGVLFSPHDGHVIALQVFIIL